MPAKMPWVWQPCLGLAWLPDPSALGLVFKKRRKRLA